MKISIFSKFSMAGGSEFRCVELANGISRFTEHDARLLAEGKVPTKLLKHIDQNVKVVENSLLSPGFLYDSGCIIVVNTDSREFSTLDYWVGKSARHSIKLDVNQLKGKNMLFLYNFLISPSRNLHQLAEVGMNASILATNKKFFNEITKQDRYEYVRSLPRYILESPIDETKLKTFVRDPEGCICFGMHSKRLGNKWNDEFYQLITDLNERCCDKIKFRFMGIKRDLKKKLDKFNNVTCLDEDEEPIIEFLSKLDVFLFFPDWKREEPWARVIAEAMVSGCPVIALDRGGTSDQVLKYNNGFLCKKYKDYFQRVVHLIEHREDIRKMSKNSIRISKSFYTQSVIEKLMKIISWGSS